MFNPKVSGVIHRTSDLAEAVKAAKRVYIDSVRDNRVRITKPEAQLLVSRLDRDFTRGAIPTSAELGFWLPGRNHLLVYTS